ncbi:alpha/beta hydrolase [Chelativorans salis]|uniref:Alpha/beta hydrolase n=1 Tax=Chelativorans salis TaxID=2978478 RepID=A0ABT2LJ57_9HYPH|nr:alpha/beta hydrolase [Chelativorans sp. EGI FJ00035]MCT7373723.1 alpha/beta hydrolase [Chelativorans sp. EGI FJ00035]
MWFLKLALALAGLYAAIIAAAYMLQTWLIFPTGLAAFGPELPADARHVELATEDGERIVLVRLPATQTIGEPRPLLLGFGGNAWNANALARMLYQIFPEHEVAALHYRGYGPSSGRPSAAALFDDARRAFDRLADEAQDGIVAIGLSLGASVAVDLAATRRLQGIVMVTPFDSLVELAASHYPWLPVRLLLRHRMDAADTLRGLDVPVAIITADDDIIVPAARVAPLREAARDLRSDIAIQGAGHNDIYGHPEFADAMRASVRSLTR